MGQIKYGIDVDGFTYAEKDGKCSYFSLDYEGMTADNGYKTNYDLVVRDYSPDVHWTWLLPLAVKNAHRQAHGMKPLKAEKPAPRWYLDWGITCEPDNREYTAPLGLEGVIKPCSEKYWLKDAYNNPSVGKVWVFDAYTDRLGPLAEAIAQNHSHLTIEMCCWSTHGWGR